MCVHVYARGQQASTMRSSVEGVVVSHIVSHSQCVSLALCVWVSVCVCGAVCVCRYVALAVCVSRYVVLGVCPSLQMFLFREVRSS